MTNLSPSDRDSAGLLGLESRTAAYIVYALYALTIPSVAALAIVGVIIAYAARSGADAVAAAHFTHQIRLFWIAAIWGVALFLASAVAWLLTIVLIGFPLLWLIGVVGFLVLLWLTVKSILGALRLYHGGVPS